MAASGANVLSFLSRRGITGTSGTLERDFAIINKRLNVELEKIKHRTNKGLLLAAIEIRRDMESTPPLIPLDFGNLRASWFIINGRTTDPTLKGMEQTSVKWNNSTPPEVLAKLKVAHTVVLAEMRAEAKKFPVGVAMGFSAYYAAPVHEMMQSPTGKPINWSRPGSGPKFFQDHVYRNIEKIVTIVKINATVRP